jgi:hypothetical protein
MVAGNAAFLIMAASWRRAVVRIHRIRLTAASWKVCGGFSGVSLPNFLTVRR